MDPLEQHTTAAAPTDRLMGRLIDFETVADTSAATAGALAGEAPSQTAAAADPPIPGAAGGETEPSAVATEAAPAWTPEDPRFLEAVDGRALDLIEQRFGPIAQLLEQTLAGGDGNTAAPQPAQPQLTPPDPFSDNYAQEFAAYQQARDEQMLGRFEQMLGQIAQPLNQRIQSETEAEGEQRLKDMLADDIARNGDFPRAPGETASKAESLVRPLAQALFPQIAQRYGNGPRAAEVAMSQAASTVRAIIAEVKAASANEQQNHLATLSEARPDLTAAGSGSGLVTIPDQPLSARERVAKYASQIQTART